MSHDPPGRVLEVICLVAKDSCPRERLVELAVLANSRAADAQRDAT